MRNFTLFFKIFFVCVLTTSVKAQIAIAKPNLGFSQACANPSFNTYNVSFSFSPETELEGANQFIIELSDATGSFSNAEIIYTSSAGSVTTSPATLTFAFPTDVSGEAYKLRIKSTAPSATSSSSNAFAAYYKLQDTPFSINNLIETGVYCSGGSYLLTIDNPGDPTNDSPLQYPSLTFKWYKETGPTTSVYVADGESLSVNEPGTYFVKTDYGTCTSSSYSNRVTVNESSTGASSSINSSLGNPFCASEGATTLSAISGNSYQWFKDGEAISGATEQRYITDESGEYSVRIDLGNCTENASINLNSEGFSSSIDIERNSILDEGETVMVTITSDASNPEYKWYRNNELISGATSNSYEAMQTGSYMAVVTQTNGCVSSSQHEFLLSPPADNIPNLVSPNNDGFNDTWILPPEYLGGTGTEVAIYNAQGKKVLLTNNYQNNWPENQLDFKDVNPIYYYIITTRGQQTRKGSITVVK